MVVVGERTRAGEVDCHVSAGFEDCRLLQSTLDVQFAQPALQLEEQKAGAGVAGSQYSLNCFGKCCLLHGRLVISSVRQPRQEQYEAPAAAPPLTQVW